jgi:enterochelin esterase-like enzyme
MVKVLIGVNVKGSGVLSPSHLDTVLEAVKLLDLGLAGALLISDRDWREFTSQHELAIWQPAWPTVYYLLALFSRRFDSGSFVRRNIKALRHQGR